MSARFVTLADDDNVVVVLDDVKVGDDLPGLGFVAAQPVAAGHKIASRKIEPGAPVIKYGQQIGAASESIQPGDHVHTHNVSAEVFSRDERGGLTPAAVASVATPASFDGVIRADGRAATRNYVGIVTTVNCSATVAQQIARQMEAELRDYPTIDGIVPITHGHGCCQGADEEGMLQLQRTLAGFIEHPNFGAVLVLGLGCETNQISLLMQRSGFEPSDTLRAMTIQGAGGTRATVENAAAQIREMLPAAASFERRPLPAGKLTLGLECGGSDGYSGVSANPALGKAADLLVAHGGTAILSETPEIYGAEHLLLNRAVSEEVAESLRERLRWWENYAEVNNSKLDNNPSHGNKAGGLTTIYEKSLGAVAKGGSSPLVDVYRYAERIDKSGFVFMDSPGYDPMSITGQVASGANLVAFTTGRGSVFGCKPVPSIKIATNTAMYQRMSDDMDVNCGRIVDGDASVETMGREIFDLLLATASGQKTRSEELGFGDNEFVPWIIGAQM